MAEEFVSAGDTRQGPDATFEIIRAFLNQSNLPVYWVKIAESEKTPKNVHENILTPL